MLVFLILWNKKTYDTRFVTSSTIIPPFFGSYLHFRARAEQKAINQTEETLLMSREDDSPPEKRDCMFALHIISYHIIIISYHLISYHIIYHLSLSSHIISYHLISSHISYYTRREKFFFIFICFITRSRWNYPSRYAPSSFHPLPSTPSVYSFHTPLSRGCMIDE